MNKAIIAAPFGNYVTLPGATRTRGTYTYEPRPGAIWGALTRVQFTTTGVFNQMGLRNPGIKGQNFSKHHDDIWSIAGLNYIDWLTCIESVPPAMKVELNFSCPNINVRMYGWAIKEVMKQAKDRFACTIVKLPANFMQATLLMSIAAEVGITHFHACNTIATERGGLSGRAIQRYSLPLVRLIHQEGFTAIGGGGVYTPDDVKRYRDYGADYFSLGTIFMVCPWRIPSVLKEINK